MSVQLPIGETADNTSDVLIEGREFKFRFRWNVLECSWYMYIGTSDTEYLIKVKLTAGHDLLEPYRYDDRLPQGLLIVVDTERAYGRLGREDFGIDKRFQLLYFTTQEIENS